MWDQVLHSTACIPAATSEICLLAVQIDAVIMEDKNSLARVPVYAEDEPTAQRELQNRLAEATRAFQKLYNGDYGSEDAAMRVASKLKNLMHALRPSVRLIASTMLLLMLKHSM